MTNIDFIGSNIIRVIFEFLTPDYLRWDAMSFFCEVVKWCRVSPPSSGWVSLSLECLLDDINDSGHWTLDTRSLRDKQTRTDLSSEKDEQENKCDSTLTELTALVWPPAKNYASTATRGIVHYGLRDGDRETWDYQENILCPDFDQLIGNQGRVRVLRSQEEHTLIIYGQRHYIRLSYLLHIEYGAWGTVVTTTILFHK